MGPAARDNLARLLAGMLGEALPEWPAGLGQPGFELPDGAALRPIAAHRAANLPGVTVDGAGVSQNNWLMLPPDFRAQAPLHLRFTQQARNNLVLIDQGSQPYGQIVCHADRGSVIFAGPTAYASQFSLQLSSTGNTFYWGARGSSNGLTVSLAGEGRSALFGSECMVAHRVSVLTSDLHPIVDRLSGEWLNEPADVRVEPHVWIGMDSTVLKGCVLGFGSVVGARSLVNRDTPRHSLNAGVPARPLRQNIAWFRPGQPHPRLLAELQALEAAFTGPG